jgi:hypothetical protein
MVQHGLAIGGSYDLGPAGRTAARSGVLALEHGRSAVDVGHRAKDVAGAPRASVTEQARRQAKRQQHGQRQGVSTMPHVSPCQPRPSASGGPSMWDAPGEVQKLGHRSSVLPPQSIRKPPLSRRTDPRVLAHEAGNGRASRRLPRRCHRALWDTEASRMARPVWPRHAGGSSELFVEGASRAEGEAPFQYRRVLSVEGSREGGLAHAAPVCVDLDAAAVVER